MPRPIRLLLLAPLGLILLLGLAACSSDTNPTPTPVASPQPTPQSLAPGETPGPTPEPTSPLSSEPTPDVSAPPTGKPPKPTPTPRATQRPPSPAVQPVRVSVEKVADGFSNPNGVFNAGDDRLFVLEQEGYVHVLKPKADGTFREVGIFLDIRDRVICCGEKGMLGIAFPPDHATTGKFYVTYAGNGHTWNLDERRVSKTDPDKADPNYRRKLISLYKPHDFHWGGDILFGSDGYLWISMGDGGFNGQPGRTGDPDNRSQDLAQLWGKILRIDPKDPDGKGSARYGIPSDNPYVIRSGAAPEVWARGLRNPWRWSFDRLIGDMWIADVGHETWEEIDRAKAPELGKGANYGWRLMEGPSCYIPTTGCDPQRQHLKMPIADYQHGNAGNGYRCATTGGYVYRGKDWPALRSWFVFGDYCSGEIFGLDANGPNHQQLRVLLDTGFAITSIGEDKNGELYLTDYTPGQEALYRIVGKPGG